ncbi:hypothetical protein [Halobaculum litoreum]|uniref:hypothetical protein n=1 Tax=Halobaculum litoreum TaxID=3031998 RepID=UPI0024C290C3|nr:hypothetical protein [Halobaculum sp. DT92]
MTAVERADDILSITLESDAPMELTLAVPDRLTTNAGERTSDRTVRVTATPGVTTIPFTDQ